MTIEQPQYEEDFFDVLQGLTEDIRERQERIYRQIERNLILVYQEVQRIQGDVIVQLARRLPDQIPEVTTSLERSK